VWARGLVFLFFLFRLMPMPDALRHVLDWSDLDAWNACLGRALHHAAHPGWSDVARGKSLGMLFFNSSLRTRTSMELAAAQLGAHPTTLDIGGGGVWGFAWDDEPMNGDRAEHIREAVGVLSRYYDALGVRLFAGLTDLDQDRSDRLLHTFAQHASVPVVNLESALLHPCQALADATTLRQRHPDASGKRFVLTWAPHSRALPQAVPHSALLTAARLGYDVTLAHPPGFDLAPAVVAQAQAHTERCGADFQTVHDAGAALDGADVVYAKAWSAPLVYTDPAAEAALRAERAEWRVTAERMARTQDAAFMHCLPVRRGVVVDGDVLDGPHAVHLDQAENRLHAQKAILEWMWRL
jgi:N-acetylornithine carbamoyltransferase